MESDLHDASILYCGHSEEPEDVSHFEGELSEGSRFVSLFLPFVGIVPSRGGLSVLCHGPAFQEDEGYGSLDFGGALQECVCWRTLPGAGYRQGVSVQQADVYPAHEGEVWETLGLSVRAWAQRPGNYFLPCGMIFFSCFEFQSSIPFGQT